MLKKQAAENTTDSDGPIVPAFHKLLAQRSKSLTRLPRVASGERLLERLLTPTPKPVVQVVLTGGPVGGKATLAARLTKTLGAMGWRVLVAPSVATTLLNSNCVLPADNDEHGQLKFEGAVLELQYALEGAMKRAASVSGEKCVIIYDRGVLDVGAFLSREQWPALAEEAPSGVKRSLDWYACIVHLVTAADGADEAFTKEVHARCTKGACALLPRLPDDAGLSSPRTARHVAKAREEAMRIDHAIHEVQRGHPGYVRVDNAKGFEAKLTKAVEVVVEKVKAAEARG